MNYNTEIDTLDKQSKMMDIRAPFDKYKTLIAMALLCILSGCTKSHDWQKEQGMIWNTVWHATYYGEADDISIAMDSLRSVEKSVSVFDDKSLISYINANDAGPIDSHLLKVYEMSVKVNRMSDGLFDPTLSPLIKAWGFGKGHTPTADTAYIADILPLVGINKTRIEKGMLIKANPKMEINFSAIAKGYGADMAAKALEDRGCRNLMFEIGGEIVCRGTNPEGKKWRIMIETPDEEYLKEIFKNDNKPTFKDNLIVELDNEALATSGNYRNFHSDSGQTYGHTISPLTGRPIKTDILSASVIAPTCMEADALATACMAMGSADAMDMLQKEGYAGAFILYSGEVMVNDKMKEHMTK